MRWPSGAWRTWPGSNGSIMPCCSAMRRIHLSLLMLMWGTRQSSGILRSSGAHSARAVPQLRYHFREQAMRRTLDLLSQYAEYHRDRRNIVTHLIGVPMIVFAVGVLLARPGFAVG